jgi:hypothetical protein
MHKPSSPNVFKNEQQDLQQHLFLNIKTKTILTM